MLKNAENNVTLRKSDLPSVPSGNVHTLSIKGMFTLQFKIEKHTYQFKTYVIRNLNYDTILGKDFLTEYNRIIDFKENKLSLETNDVCLRKQVTPACWQVPRSPKHKTNIFKTIFIFHFTSPCNFPNKNDYCLEPNPSSIVRAGI